MKHTAQFDSFATTLSEARRRAIETDVDLSETRGELTATEQTVVDQSPAELDLVGVGLARIVFSHRDTDTVLKIARAGDSKINAGTQQNEREVQTYDQCGEEFSLVPLTDYDDDFLWVEMQEVPMLEDIVSDERASEVETSLRWHFSDCPRVEIFDVRLDNLGVYDGSGALLDYGTVGNPNVGMTDESLTHS